MNGRLDGREVVVTGAASGIGRALAERAKARGASVIVSDIEEPHLADTAAALGAEDVVADVAVPADVERLAAAAPNARLVCLNAGVASEAPRPSWEASPEEWERVLQVNLLGVVNGLRAFVPRLLAAGEPAAILITVSLAGLVTWRDGGPYAASKHAAMTVAEQAALELADTCIDIGALCPAFVRTGMHPWGKEPSDVAEEALVELSRGRFTIVPTSWQAAVARRGAVLSSGDRPTLPEETM